MLWQLLYIYIIYIYIFLLLPEAVLGAWAEAVGWFSSWWSGHPSDKPKTLLFLFLFFFFLNYDINKIYLNI